ncbi:MAG: riboflavin synthase [Candidatus Omnitrophota bacterium]|jgi:riboflavin synthase
MFSGIVEELGEILKISRRGNLTLFKIRALAAAQDTNEGDSISVNGACLTVVEKEKDALFFEAMPETVKMTNLGSLRIGDKVNLERALKIGERVSGHFVTGHIDTTGVIRQKRYLEGNLCFEIAIPPKFTAYILPKGSIAVDGISLTVMDKRSATFFVYIIPHTLKNTTLGFKGPSDKVNIEFDILAKRPVVSC